MLETTIGLQCILNGDPLSYAVSPTRRLLDLLREDLRLTGTKIGCEVGRCGACMVLVDGHPVNACLLMAYQCQGRTIETIEGVSPPASGLHPIQKAIVEEGGLQCGYCTPGMVISLKALLERQPCPTREETEEALCGNLCRCTGYEGLLRAVAKVSTQDSDVSDNQQEAE
ncbi:(2Fe-2S)-binding protein [Paenibacillus sp. GCM10023252]|uniref:(2Fe-2S)-binding protein n=1 Tax=Paenibacillus sp. GCM10023252 TaxID=3252649 RepID=UPI00361F59D6